MSKQGWQYVATCTSKDEPASVWAGTVFASKLDAAEDMVNDIAEQTKHHREMDEDEPSTRHITRFIDQHMRTERDANDWLEAVYWDEPDVPYVWRVIPVTIAPPRFNEAYDYIINAALEKEADTPT